MKKQHDYEDCMDCINCHLNDICAASPFVKKTVVKHKTEEQLSLF